MTHWQLETRSSRTTMENDEDIRTKTTYTIKKDEAMQLQNSDNLGMTLVSVPLTRDKFLPWSR